MERWIALFRGINVGGKNKVPMAALATIFERAGAKDVRTYIQSGNVIYTAKKDVLGAVAKACTKELGVTVPIVACTAAELEGAVRDSPFSRKEEDALHLGVLLTSADPVKIAALDPKRSPPDRFVVDGRMIYLHLPNGMGETKLTNAYFDAKLGTVSTFRNWRTVRALLDLL